MTMRNGLKSTHEETVVEAQVGVSAAVNGNRKMTLVENVILTIKILAGFGLLGAALWGVSLWQAPR